MPEVPAFLLAFTALAIGTIVGWFVQRTLVSIEKNGAWPDTPGWKKRSLSMRGSIAALLAGLFVLQGAEAFNGWNLVWRMWLWQTGASVAGASGIEWIMRLLGKGTR